MKKEEFTNNIEKYIIEELAKHCHDTGQNVFDLMQNENLRSTINIILNDSKKLFYQINTTNEKQKRDNMNNTITQSSILKIKKGKKLTKRQLFIERQKRALEKRKTLIDKYKDF